MRLFIAIEIPANLKTALGQLRTDIPGARWVPLAQVHLTLAFLGEVEQEAVERLSRRLAHIQATAFELNFSGAGCFPSRKQPRVIWIGVEPEPCLVDLAARIHEAVQECGIPQEERPFSAHITLARLRSPAPMESAAFLDRHRKVALPPFSVQEFILFQSHLTTQGAVHTPIKRFALAVPGVSWK